MKLKEIGSTVLGLVVIVIVIGGLILMGKESKRIQEINHDYVENSGLRITPGRVYNRGFNSEYLDVYVGEITMYVDLAKELNIKTVYLREGKLSFEIGNTIYTTNLRLGDPSIDYTETR